MGCVILFFTFSSLPAWAQTSEVRGTVKDANGESLIGVNVVRKGTSDGTVTDLDGNFVLKV